MISPEADDWALWEREMFEAFMETALAKWKRRD